MNFHEGKGWGCNYVVDTSHVVVQVLWYWALCHLSYWNNLDGSESQQWRIQKGGGGSGGSLEHPSPHPFLSILWKWNNLVSVRPSFLHFHGIFKKMRSNQPLKANPTPLYIWTPFQKSWVGPWLVALLRFAFLYLCLFLRVSAFWFCVLTTVESRTSKKMACKIYASPLPPPQWPPLSVLRRQFCCCLFILCCWPYSGGGSLLVVCSWCYF